MNRMHSRYISTLRTLILSAAISGIFSLPVFAMGVKISFNDPTAAPGEDVTVSMHVSSDGGTALGSADIMLKYDASILEFVSGDNAEGGAGTLHLTGQATTDASEWYYGIHFKALKEGSGSVTVTSAEVYDRDEKIAELTHQGSAKVTVGGGASQSEGTQSAALSSLSMTPGELKPAFSPETTSYTATVGDEVTRIAVSAVPAKSGAKVTVSGNEDLKLGENTITIRVADENGAELGSYAIAVTKQEGLTPTEQEEQQSKTVKIGETSYQVADSFDESLLPSGFTAETYNYHGNSVLSGKGKDDNLRLMYLLAEGGAGNLFLYDATADHWTPYVEVGMSARAVTAIPLGKDTPVPSDLIPNRLNLNGKTVDGWIGKTDNGQNFCVFYGMNAEGEKNFYRFDLSEKTIQRYFTDASAGDGEKEALEASELQRTKARLRRRTFELYAAVAAALAAAAAALLLAFRTRTERTGVSLKQDWEAKEELEVEAAEVPDAFDDDRDDTRPMPQQEAPLREAVGEEKADAGASPEDDDDFETIDL